MTDSVTVNPTALEPLFMPWEFPNAHRERAEREGGPAKIVNRRRLSPITMANNLRAEVRLFREANYAGASDTSRELLIHWFETDHTTTLRPDSGQAGKDGLTVPFRYYFCQREAIETLIYLYEVRRVRNLSEITGEFGGRDAERAAMGIDPQEDRWPKYAFNLHTNLKGKVVWKGHGAG